MLGLIKKYKRIVNLLLIILLIIVLLYLNFTSRGFGLDLIILTFAIIAWFLNREKEFIKDWFIFVILFWVYEWIRGYGDNIATFLHLPLQLDLALNIDKLMFLGKVPTVVLQNLMPPSSTPWVFLATLFFFYTSFFWFWAGVGFILWLKNKCIFKKYFWTLLLVSFLGAIFFALLPSAPPWYASSQGLLPPLDRFLWSRIFPGSGISFVHAFDQNYFAALPSLHFSWPFLGSIYITKYYKNWGLKRYLVFIFPFMILLAIVYGAEHYITDALLGGLLVFLSYFIVKKFYKCSK